jgi:hypothetical protein
MNFTPFSFFGNKSKKTTFITFSGFTADTNVYSGTSTNGPGLYCLAVQSEASASRSITSVTINGTNANFIESNSISSSPIFIRANLYWFRTTASSFDIVATFSGTVLRGGFALWSIENVNSDTPVQTATSSTSSVAVTSLETTFSTLFVGGDVGIIVQTNGTENSNISWTNATERYESTVESLVNFGGADFTVPDGNNYTVTTFFNSSTAIGVGAIWN